MEIPVDHVLHYFIVQFRAGLKWPGTLTVEAKSTNIVGWNVIFQDVSPKNPEFE